MLRTTPASSIEALESRIAPAAVYTVSVQNDGPHLEKVYSILGAVTDVGLMQGFINSTEETVVDMDFRSATGELYLLTRDTANAGHLYTVNLLNGAVSGGFVLQAAEGDGYTSLPTGPLGVDFDSKLDRLRIVAPDGTNLSVDPVTDEVTTLGAFRYASDNNEADPGGAVHLASIAFSNAVPNQGGMLYGLDIVHNTLVYTDANDPTVVHTKGSLGEFPFDDISGFDLGYDGTGYAQFVGIDEGKAAMFRLDLSTGEATLIEQTISNVPLRGAATPPFSANVVNAKTLQYTDIDGDTVTIKTTKGSLVALADSLEFIQGGTRGAAQLSNLDLTATNLTAAGLSANDFKGAVITITASAGRGQGDGFANVGVVDTTGVAIKSLTVDGDLGRFYGGAPFLSQDSYTLAGLTVQSLGAAGRWSPLLQDLGLGVSEAGAVTALTVKTNVHAGVTVDSNLGTLKIGGSIVGDPRDHSDSMHGTEIFVGGKIGTATVKGSIYGGARDQDGRIYGRFGIGTVTVGGSIWGGDAPDSGSIASDGGITRVTVGGSIYGGDGEDSGTISSGPRMVFMANPEWTLGTVTVTGSIIGGNGAGSGSVAAGFGVKQMSVGGSIVGGSADRSGSIYGAIAVGTLKVNGDVIGGSGVNSGSIVGQLGVLSVSIRGSLSSGTENRANAENGIFGGFIGSVKIGGDLLGTSSAPVHLASSGLGAQNGFAIQSVQVGGTMADALITAGTSSFGSRADTSIGTVKIGGDFVRSTIAAGVVPGDDGFYGTGDDGEGQIPGQDSATLAVIKSVVIGGQVIGTAGASEDGYAIAAEQVQTVKVGEVTYRLLADQTETIALGLTGDVRIAEYNQSVF